ncbi:gluconeogenesis factor YvcK family protein [Desulforhopalus singaporensis]|uniref:YvcK family protein n=1 Tax=Desulforhopalus singaporensis TaxID=91360 RepID=A0A1H0PDW7_9BACT|nr:gluconeogenesis factor YvcK family protein [Desulforhopalus singaporensis]SDP03317.1 conserved hypothetical protein, cofD-related [Desulforhopalus singaporensis]
MIKEHFSSIKNLTFSPLELQPGQDIREKLVDLVLQGVPAQLPAHLSGYLKTIREELLQTGVENVRVVVFGGGTGLSNIIGGDSRLYGWCARPYNGLKELFPRTRSVVCVTDDGGSTGELLKDIDLIAVGDIRHVLLSSVQLNRLWELYNLGKTEAHRVAGVLWRLFNWRFTGPLTRQHPHFQEIKKEVESLPQDMASYLRTLMDYLFVSKKLGKSLKRSHCMGNLLIAAAVFREQDNYGASGVDDSDIAAHCAIRDGLDRLGRIIGAAPRAVMPCTSTPAQLRVLYTNGVEITGEHKLSTATRGVPVDSVHVDYCGEARTYDEIIEDIERADIVVFAPGSLYSSIIPVFKVPGLAEAVRSNTRAMKILISNLWVQAGETDLSLVNPERKFHVSDMIRAYEENIPGGTRDLFNEVLCVSLKDIPGSVLQRYGVEGKVPIYLDKEKLVGSNFFPVECDIFSTAALNDRGVIQHDQERLALAIKALYNGRKCWEKGIVASREGGTGGSADKNLQPQNRSTEKCPEKLRQTIKPYIKYRKISEKIDSLKICCIGLDKKPDLSHIKSMIVDILCDHPVIPIAHLGFFRDIFCVSSELWKRDQQWDNVFSFFDPADGCIKIRADQFRDRRNLEVAFMVALGESLLGNYAAEKIMEDVVIDGIGLGRVYHLYLAAEPQRRCYFDTHQIKTFLSLSRMCDTGDHNHYTRLVNRGEGFTPPGLLMGLMYAWYVDNQLASHIEYKMSVMKIRKSDLIPEQVRMADRRRKMVDFFREVVFYGDLKP